MTNGLFFDLGNALPVAARRSLFPRLRVQRANSSVESLRRVLIDVSIISRHDAGTGIQRVVREIMMYFLEHPPEGVSVQLVGETRKHGYCYLHWDGVALQMERLDAVQPDCETAFVGLDLSLDAIVCHHAQLRQWRARGVRFHFMVYDLLPLLHPEWFTKKLTKRFNRWFAAISLLADSMLVISSNVRRDVQNRLQHSYGLKPIDVPAVILPMGADFRIASSKQDDAQNMERWLTHFRHTKAILMVGTLEPRKGHEQVLDAFEELWRQGRDASLVIVGRPGWHTESLQARIRNHHEIGRRLFWFDDASDATLRNFYQVCYGVIIASFAEGFGLPLIEALSYGKPILARDIPVFREREQPGVQFFTAQTGRDLAVAIAEWFDHIEKTGSLGIRPIVQYRWRDTATTLIDWARAIHTEVNNC